MSQMRRVGNAREGIGNPTTVESTPAITRDAEVVSMDACLTVPW